MKKEERKKRKNISNWPLFRETHSCGRRRNWARMHLCAQSQFIKSFALLQIWRQTSGDRNGRQVFVQVARLAHKLHTIWPLRTSRRLALTEKRKAKTAYLLRAPSKWPSQPTGCTFTPRLRPKLCLFALFKQTHLQFVIAIAASWRGAQIGAIGNEKRRRGEPAERGGRTISLPVVCLSHALLLARAGRHQQHLVACLLLQVFSRPTQKEEKPSDH